MKEGLKLTIISKSTTTNKNNINNINNNNSNEKEENGGIHEFADSQFGIICKEIRLWEELKIFRDFLKRGEAVQQRCILAIELNVNEYKEFVYAEKRNWKLKYKLVKILTWISLMRTKDNFEFAEENAGDNLFALEGTINNFNTHIEFVEIQTNLTMITEYAEHERLTWAKVEPCIYWYLPKIREKVESFWCYWKRVVFCYMYNVEPCIYWGLPKIRETVEKWAGEGGDSAWFGRFRSRAFS